MKTKRVVFLAGLIFTFLLSACQPGGGNDLVGRWEFGDAVFGNAFEFNEDGNGVNYTSLDPFYPMVGVFTYTFDPQSGVLKIKTGDDMERSLIYLVTFVTTDEISVEQSGMNKPMSYIRKPLPELPAEARARIGGMLIDREFTLIETRELAAGWEDDYNDYAAVARTNLDLVPGEDPISWLVTIQLAGEEQNSLLVLLKGAGKWGVIELIAKN